ncbi:MAG: very short patch repair endonuclease [Gammaproteobacteria bacterium]|nr:very short patch repair endonuclease [Gammaproteobacteria bacterium]
MQQVKQSNTAPELAVRKFLFSRGYRYRLHRKSLPGNPDIVFPSRRKVIFVHGCFWHGHQDCSRSTLPRTRLAYWRGKIEKNRERDAFSITALQQLGWGVYVIWECKVKGLIELETDLISFLEDRI